MAILTVYTKLLDKTLEGARIIDMGSTKSCECFVLPRDKVAEVAKKQPHLQQYGFYILLGRDKCTPEPTLLCYGRERTCSKYSAVPIASTKKNNTK